MSYPERVLPFVERGALLQLAAGSVAGLFGEKAEAAARWFLERELVQFVASDAHHPVRRAPAMALAARTLSQWVGNEQCASLTTDNPNKLTQFEAALLRASELGPWEPYVMENSAVLGFHYRGWLSDELQTELDNSYQKLVKQYPHRARQIAQQYQ